MKAYQKPSVEVMAFSKENVITTSGLVGVLLPADYTAATQWKPEWEQLSEITE